MIGKQIKISFAAIATHACLCGFCPFQSISPPDVPATPDACHATPHVSTCIASCRLFLSSLSLAPKQQRRALLPSQHQPCRGPQSFFCDFISGTWLRVRALALNAGRFWRIGGECWHWFAGLFEGRQFFPQWCLYFAFIQLTAFRFGWAPQKWMSKEAILGQREEREWQTKR